MSGYTDEVNSLIIRNQTNQIVMPDPSFLAPTTTISCSSPAASTTLSIPDPGVTASNFILSSGSNTFTSAPVFSNGAFFTKSSNQLQIQPGGSGASFIINASTPGNSRTLTIPDPGASAANILLSQGSQTIAGSNTFSATTTFSSSVNQISLVSGSGNIFDLSLAAAPAQGTTAALYDPGTALTDWCLGVKNVTSVSSVTTLSASQSGRIIAISNAGSAYNLTLPAVAKGLSYMIVVASAPAAAITIKSPSANVYGSVVSSDGTAVSNGNITSAKTNLIVGTTAAIGDTYEIYSPDGSNYIVRGVTAVHGSITFS